MFLGLREHEMRSNPCIISVKIPFDAFIIKSDKWCVGVLVGGLEEHRGGSASGRRSFAVDDADHCYGEQDSEQHGHESQIIVEEVAFQIRQEGAEEVEAGMEGHSCYQGVVVVGQIAHQEADQEGVDALNDIHVEDSKQ